MRVEAVEQKLRVVEVDPLSDDRWDAFARRHGVVYHHSSWLRALEREYPHESIALLCEDANGVCGILPLIRTRGLPPVLKPGRQVVEPRLSSLPRTPVAGPLFTSREAGAALLGAAIERVRAEPRLRLQLKPEGTLDSVTDGVLGVPWRLTYVLSLPVRSEELRFGSSRNHARIKWSVNKAIRANVKVRVAESSDDLRAWYQLYLEAMRWHAVPARPYRLFEAMQELLHANGLMTLLLAEQFVHGRRRLLAGSIFLQLGETMFYAFNGRRLDALSLRPNDLLLWNAIHDAWDRGCQRVDLGEVVEGDEGLGAFKRKWGTTPTRLYRYYYPPLPAAREEEEEESHGQIATLAKAAWRRAPLWATQLVGDAVYRYL